MFNSTCFNQNSFPTSSRYTSHVLQLRRRINGNANKTTCKAL